MYSGYLHSALVTISAIPSTFWPWLAHFTLRRHFCCTSTETIVTAIDFILSHSLTIPNSNYHFNLKFTFPNADRRSVRPICTISFRSFVLTIHWNHFQINFSFRQLIYFFFFHFVWLIKNRSIATMISSRF